MTEHVGEIEEKDPAELASRERERFTRDDTEAAEEGGDVTADDSGRIDVSVQADAGGESSSDDSDSDSESDADDGYATADDSKFIDHRNDSSSEHEEDPEVEDSDEDEGDSDEEGETRQRRGEAEDRMRQRWMAEWRDWARDNLRSFPDLAHCDDWGWDQWDEWRSSNTQRLDTFYQTPFRDDLP